MKQYDKERKNEREKRRKKPALDSSKWKVNYVKVLWKLHQQSLCWAGPYGQVLTEDKFHCPIKMGYPMQNLSDNQSVWSISMGTPWSIYGVQGKEHSQTKTGKDSVLSSTKILQEE
jgi:hypothetical protein